MKNNMKELVVELKDKNQDFEFYPTTEEIIKVINEDLKNVFYNNKCSILDIGAGNGNVFSILDKLNSEKKDKYGNIDKVLYITKYAIEKSEVLLNEMSSDIFVVGTDFYQQSLIDKKVDVIFCNPPYKDYIFWMQKIIAEANSKYIYFVVPERWKDLQLLTNLIKKRESKYELLDSFDFVGAERPSRAKIEIIKIINKNCYSDVLNTDPFDIWFDTFFDIKVDEEDIPDYEKEKFKKEELKKDLIKGKNLIERLDELYKLDFDNLINNYKMLEKLDFKILKELGVNLGALKNGLKLKIEGLKNLYWEELFNNLDSVTDRLTKRSREKLLAKLMAHTTVDFSISNVYAVVIWIIKNVNLYLNSQLLDVYKWMSSSENVQNYKSNKKFIEDGWRFNCDLREGFYTHYSLDYRLVFMGHNNFRVEGCYSYDYLNNLNKSTHDCINDILTIAKNLGFTVKQNTYNFQWEPGKEYLFTDAKGKEFLKVRAYKNGNIHCKMNQKFMKKLNIEAGRLNNWIKSPKEASEELDIPMKEVETLYNKNFQLPLKNIPFLLENNYRG